MATLLCQQPQSAISFLTQSNPPVEKETLGNRMNAGRRHRVSITRRPLVCRQSLSRLAPLQRLAFSYDIVA